MTLRISASHVLCGEKGKFTKTSYTISIRRSQQPIIFENK